jgi:transposase
VLLSLVNSTIADVSIKEGIGYKAAEGIVDRYIEAEVNWDNIPTIGLLGIDEISLKKGYRDYVTLLTSRSEQGIRILGVIKGREKVDVKQFLSSIPVYLRKTIIAVCSDMYDGFINAAKEVFGSAIPVVADRYHVSKLYRKSLISLRKKELKKLKKSFSKEKYQELKPAISLLCKRKECELNEQEKEVLKPLFDAAPRIKKAYAFSLQLTAIYNKHSTTDEALKSLDLWISEVGKSDINCFKDFIKTLKKYKVEICNYFVGRHNSGFVEGCNNKIKVLKRRCYGIFNIKHLFKRIVLDFSGYNFLGVSNLVKI